MDLSQDKWTENQKLESVSIILDVRTPEEIYRRTYSKCRVN